MPVMIPNIAPDEMQCIGCDCIKSSDEIEWSIWDAIGVVACIDCADDLDEFLANNCTGD